MKRFSLLCISLLLLLSTGACAKKKPREGAFQVMSYNVENLFDTSDDPHTNDNEFLPDGTRHWTQKRYRSHLEQTARVILAAGAWESPALVGLCEVENEAVLQQLMHHTHLRSEGYRSCITRGNDPRGINNALLYRQDRFRLLGWRSVRIPFADRAKRSRDLLHAWGRIASGDTLDVIVCHFPSRRNGRKASEPDRIDAARCVRRLCDSLGRSHVTSASRTSSPIRTGQASQAVIITAAHGRSWIKCSSVPCWPNASHRHVSLLPTSCSPTTVGVVPVAHIASTTAFATKAASATICRSWPHSDEAQMTVTESPYICEPIHHHIIITSLWRIRNYWKS